jgi:Ca2+-binding EF-hand superfamily protein
MKSNETIRYCRKLKNLYEIFKRVDANGDGDMDYKEFAGAFFQDDM